jgi:aromatic-L-amino-acid decarboxylase
MGVNFDCDLFWVADRAALTSALSILPEYLRTAATDSGAAVDLRDWGIPLGRRFRALKLWFTIRSLGIADVQAMIERHVALAAEVASWVGADARFELAAPPALNLVCLRHVDGDEATDRLLNEANASGQALFTRTVLGGRSAIRISVGGRRTEARHVEAGWKLLQSLA